VTQTKLDRLGLSDSEYSRLVSWMVDIASELLPGEPVQRGNGEVRVGYNRGLAIYDGGRWYSYVEDEGGRGPRSMLAFLRPGIEPIELRRMVVEWLRDHPGNGDLSDEGLEREADHTELVQLVLREMVPVDGTLGEEYLRNRGLPSGWPRDLMG
jgi:hypothetical protein